MAGPVIRLGDRASHGGTACGHAGAVPFVAALTLAHQQALARQAPVLCVSNEDDRHRSAVLVRPQALQSRPRRTDATRPAANPFAVL